MRRPARTMPQCCADRSVPRAFTQPNTGRTRANLLGYLRPMKGKPKKSPREKDLTSRYFSGNLDEDRVEQGERFGDRSRHFQQRKTEKTAILRAAEETVGGDIDALPVGDVIRVYSLFCEVESAGRIWFCVVRRTLTKVAAGFIVVGDQVRFRDGGAIDGQGRAQAGIGEMPPPPPVLPRPGSL